MSCLCGDVCCPSCGPAQGNWQCPVCRAWASEGCEHYGEDGEPASPEAAAQIAEAVEAERKAEDAMYEAEAQLERLFEAEAEAEAEDCPDCAGEGWAPRAADGGTPVCGACGVVTNDTEEEDL